MGDRTKRNTERNRTLAYISIDVVSTEPSQQKQQLRAVLSTYSLGELENPENEEKHISVFLFRFSKIFFNAYRFISTYISTVSYLRIYRVFHGIGNQEQGCCELVFGVSEGPRGFFVTPRLGANYFLVRNNIKFVKQ